jgi:predicted TIM-barrel fold metal-dependent hydrolase
VLREAAMRDMSAVIHIGGGTFGADEVEVFIREILPSAHQSWVQIAHAGGGYPFTDDRHVAVLDAFAEHFAAGDPRVRHVLFDLSYVPAPEESAATVSTLVRAMREIGLERFVFGSDFNVLTPLTQIEYLERLGLAQEEYAALKANCAPWACAVGGAK